MPGILTFFLASSHGPRTIALAPRLPRCETSLFPARSRTIATGPFPGRTGVDAQTLTDERMWNDLETEVRPLLAVIKSALSESIFGPGDSVTDLMDAVPIDTCIRLAEVWSAAAGGTSGDDLLARFPPEEQFILELVTSVFAPQHPAAPGRSGPAYLDRLLDEAVLTPPPL